MLIGGFSGVWVMEVSFMDGSCRSVSSVWNLRRVMRRARATRRRSFGRSEVSDSLCSSFCAVLYNVFRFSWVTEWSRSNPVHFDDTLRRIGSNDRCEMVMDTTTTDETGITTWVYPYDSSHLVNSSE